MKRFALITAVISLASCDEVIFDRMPGTEIKKVPKELRGEYLSFSVEDERKSSDTARIKITAKHTIEIKDGKSKKETVINSSRRLSKFGNYYFISTRDAKGWSCVVIEPDGNNLNVVPVVADDDTLKKVVTQYFSGVEEKKDEDGKAYVLVKMNEEELIRFYHKYLKPIYSVRLQKL